MSLYLSPHPCQCGTHAVDASVLSYKSHQLDAPCPYAAEGFYPGRMGTCCSIWADKTVALLQQRGEVKLVERLYQAMSCSEAAAFAAQLFALAGQLVQEYLATRTTDPDKRIMVDTMNGLIAYALPEDFYLEQVLSSIVMPARWYELTAEQHLGVNAERLCE